MSNENNPAELTILISEFLDKIIPAEGVGTVREQQRMRLHKEIFHLISPSPVEPKTLAPVKSLEECKDEAIDDFCADDLRFADCYPCRECGIEVAVDENALCEDCEDKYILAEARKPAPSVSEWRDVSKGELPEEWFWKRLISFVENVLVGDPMSEEEKQMIIHVATRYLPNPPQ